MMNALSKLKPDMGRDCPLCTSVCIVVEKKNGDGWYWQCSDAKSYAKNGQCEGGYWGKANPPAARAGYTARQPPPVTTTKRQQYQQYQQHNEEEEDEKEKEIQVYVTNARKRAEEEVQEPVKKKQKNAQQEHPSLVLADAVNYLAETLHQNAITNAVSNEAIGEQIRELFTIWKGMVGNMNPNAPAAVIRPVPVPMPRSAMGMMEITSHQPEQE